jgi:GNAT superfamily N-acetyltransferase
MDIRPATAADAAGIAAWTQDTFRWGDYIPDQIAALIEEPQTAVFVAVDEDSIVGTVNCRMVGPDEAWAGGMRVHPDHRRRGIGTGLSEKAWDWARNEGATVVRLAVEEDNGPARAQVEAMGFRIVSQWLYGARAIGADSPVPEGNGGQRVAPAERIGTAHSAEAEPAYLSWSTGELGRAGRGLLASRWTWRRLAAEHIAEAAKRGDLYEGRPGWAIAEVADGTLEVEWFETAPDDARAMVLALVDLASEAGVAEIHVMVPAVEWLSAELERFGFELDPVGVYALPL